MTTSSRIYIVSAINKGYRILFLSAEAVYRNYSLKCRVSHLGKLPSPSSLNFPDLLRAVILLEEGMGEYSGTFSGYAKKGGKEVFISLKGIFSEVEETFFSRLYKEVVYWLGISLGLENCENQTCPMCPAKNNKELDRRCSNLCKQCREEAQSIIRSLTS